jgi:hypothetical protein
VGAPVGACTCEVGKTLPPWSAERFLADLKQKEQEVGVDSAIDLALQIMNYFLLAARTQDEATAKYAVDEIQKVLDLLDPNDHDPSVLWGILIQAWNGQRVGLIYPPFLAKIEKHFKDNKLFEKDGFDADAQFRDIRGMTEGPTLGDMARSLGGNQNMF